MSVPPLIIECFLPRINSKQRLSVPDEDVPNNSSSPTSPKSPRSKSPLIPKVDSKQNLMHKVDSKQNLMHKVDSKQNVRDGIPRVGSKPQLYLSSIPRVASNSRLFGSNIPRVSSRPLLYNVEDDQEYKPDPLIVSENFESKNGILGVPIDIWKKLLSTFSSEEKKVRAFVALNKEIFEHAKQSKNVFTPSLVNDLKTQSEEDLIITNNKVSIVKCSNNTRWTWAFVDYILEKSTSIFHLNLRYNRPSKFEKRFGVMEVNDDLPYGDVRNAAMFCMYSCDGEVVQNGGSEGNNRWKENDIVSIQVNTQNSTLHFSVNGRQQPVSYSNIPPRLRFGMAELCSFVNGYHITGPSFFCARYQHRMHEVRRLADLGEEVEVVSFQRFSSEPKLQLPPADVYDPDHSGIKSRILEWNYLGKKDR